ncbi:MAG: tetratricopeptide repeat protein [Candidatus Saccharicenans sp.]|jgi:Tfp pilus assembly protein PilF|nr:tetratricopeptide repeat protein [Candidatus Saccharicenans sp.]MDH7493371.1 tetratricopeptide repeat protein [Candidatus Saccharicenans sp.]
MKSQKIQSVLVLFLVLALTTCASTQSKLDKAKAKDPQYQYNLGLFYLNNNNLDEAIKYFNKSLSLDPKNHLAWNALGLAQSIKGNFEASVQAFRKALEANPQFTEARNNLGTIYFELGQYDKAEAEYRQALLDPNYTSRELPYYNLARLFFVQEKYDEAYDNVQKAIQVKNRFAMAHNLRGLILEKTGDLEEAVVAFEQAVKIVPEDTTFLFNLARAQYDTGQYRKSKENFEKLYPRLVSQEDRDAVKKYLEELKKLVKD